METPGPEQAPHPYKVMPEPRMLPLLWAKNTAFAMGNLNPKHCSILDPVMRNFGPHKSPLI